MWVTYGIYRGVVLQQRLLPVYLCQELKSFYKAVVMRHRVEASTHIARIYVNIQRVTPRSLGIGRAYRLLVCLLYARYCHALIYA
jgi:hypothetical protein